MEPAREKSKIEGKTIHGDVREYTFLLLPAKEGTKLFHQYVSVVITALPTIKGFFKGENPEEQDAEETEEKGFNFFDFVNLVSTIFSWETVEHLAKQLVAKAEIVKEGKTFVVDDEGFGDYAKGDPTEVYAAIFYAVCANWPPYMDPLLEALGEENDQGDSTQDSPTQKETK